MKAVSRVRAHDRADPELHVTLRPAPPPPEVVRNGRPCGSERADGGGDVLVTLSASRRSGEAVRRAVGREAEERRLPLVLGDEVEVGRPAERQAGVAARREGEASDRASEGGAIRGEGGPAGISARGIGRCVATQLTSGRGRPDPGRAGDR